MGIERGNGWVRIDGVRVENFRKVDGFEDRLEEICNERIFIWTRDNINGTSAPTTISEQLTGFLPGIPPRFCWKNRSSHTEEISKTNEAGGVGVNQ